MKKILQKKKITTILFLIILFGYSIANCIHTVPKLLEIRATQENPIAAVNENIASVENVVSEEILGRYIYIEGYGLYNKLLDKREYNDFSHIMAEDGSLHYSNFWNEEKDDVTKLVEQVEMLQEQVKENGTEVVILIPPSKEDMSAVTFETGMPYSDFNKQADAYRKLLEDDGFKVLDYRDEAKNWDMPYEDRFFHTDHHWTIRSAFHAFEGLVEHMNEWYDLNLDADGTCRNIENYNVLAYDNAELGSHGRATGIVYAGGMDDFEVIYPKYSTLYNYTTGGKYATANYYGRFEDTLLTSMNIDNQDTYNQDLYNAYLGGVANYDEIDNLQMEDGIDVLFLRDSYTSPLVAFSSQVFDKTDLIWTYDLKWDLSDYLEGKSYDYIFVSLYPDSLTKEMFQFYK